MLVPTCTRNRSELMWPWTRPNRIIAFSYGDPCRHVPGCVSCLADVARQFGENHASVCRHAATNIAGQRLPLRALKGLDRVVAVSDFAALAARL